MKNRIGCMLLLLVVGGSIFAQVQSKNRENFKPRFISLSTGVKLEYVETGKKSGTPVIFLHGITDSWHSFQKVLPLLPSNIHAFAISQRGHGDSERPTAGYHPKDFAADVAAFIRQKKLERVVVVGHSMGSVVAQQFALDYPHLLKGLVLIGADAALKDNEGMPEFYNEVLLMNDRISRDYMEAFQKATLANDIEAQYFKTVVDEGLKVPAPVFAAALAGLLSVDFTEQLNTITVPTVIFWGEKDAFCSASDQERLVNNLRHAKKLVYRETGHALHWEKPQRFVNDLLDFLYKVDSNSGSY